MNQFRRMVIINIITLIVLVGGGIGGYYYYNQAENYLKTENAKIDGKVIPIASPAAGKLTDWKAEVGKNYNENDKLGAVTVAGANGGANSRRNNSAKRDSCTIKRNDKCFRWSW